MFKEAGGVQIRGSSLSDVCILCPTEQLLSLRFVCHLSIFALDECESDALRPVLKHAHVYCNIKVLW